MSEIKWTNEQLQAIKTEENNILVAAAAGSGKTAVLVERIINKIVNNNIDIDQMLIVTFTNAAASEMREKILEAVYKKIEEEPDNIHLQRQINLISRANICTIDSFCLDIVKNNFYKIGVSSNFRIADTAELELIKQEAIEELFNKKYETENEDFINVLETYTTYSSDEPLMDLIINIYNFIQSNPFPNKWLEEQVEKYNFGDKLNNDFSSSNWGKIIIENIKEELNNSKEKLILLKNNINKFEELNKYILVLNQDIDMLNKVLKFEKWDDIYSFLQEMSFERWPVDKKIVLEEKEMAKDKRNDIKKEINDSLKIIDCNSHQANKDINDMYKVLCIIKNLILEYDELLKKFKSEKNIVDFNDIEHMALNILLLENEEGKIKPTEVAKKYMKKFKEIAIDEYQDSNLIQESILTSISNGKNIFMVGDVKQSIYKFRQARPELFLDKYEKYNKLNERVDKSIGNKIQLFKNFRSRANVLDTVNCIFQEIMSQHLGDIDYSEEEYLNLGADFKETDLKGINKNTEIYVIENIDKENSEEIEEEHVENIELEAKFVAKKIKNILDSKQVIFDKKVGYRPITFKDIVILLRSTKDKANIFETELINLNIPVYSDTSLEYLNSIEIQIIMNLLKIIDNPTVDIPLVAVLRSMIGNFDDNELIKIRLLNKKVNFYQAMLLYNKEDNIKEKIDIFLKRINEWKRESEYLELNELIWKIYIDTGYYNYVSLMPNGILRQANLKLLFEKAKQYEDASFKGLYNFINFIEKIRNGSGDLSSAKLISENENVVRIMSIHKSKGLEFPLVFLCNSNKKFNMQDLNIPILLHHDLGLGLNYIDSKRKLQYSTLAKEAIKIKSKEEIISEEMRILYVALTRAKEKLIITGVSKELEQDLKEKEEALNIYQKDEKINKSILKKYKSYLDWIELVYLKLSRNDLILLNSVKKSEILDLTENIESENNEIKLEDLNKDVNDKNIQIIKNKLNWKYEYLELSKIEGKTSVSDIKNKKIKEISNNKLTKNPIFSNKETTKLTAAQKGTLIHLCMQNLDTKEQYTKEKIEELLETLKIRKKITQLEAESIDTNKILNFTNSNIWKELQNAKLIEREKTFYITIPAGKIYENNLEEPILVQGIIDLFYINSRNELILVDYKTDSVKYETELISKYSTQLNIYKNALEEALNKKVDKVYIYSTYLNKEIEL